MPQTHSIVPPAPTLCRLASPPQVQQVPPCACAGLRRSDADAGRRLGVPARVDGLQGFDESRLVRAVRSDQTVLRWTPQLQPSESGSLSRTPQ
jgi:hypothetical protein